MTARSCKSSCRIAVMPHNWLQPLLSHTRTSSRLLPGGIFIVELLGDFPKILCLNMSTTCPLLHGLLHEG